MYLESSNVWLRGLHKILVASHQPILTHAAHDLGSIKYRTGILQSGLEDVIWNACKCNTSLLLIKTRSLPKMRCWIAHWSFSPATKAVSLAAHSPDSNGSN